MLFSDLLLGLTGDIALYVFWLQFWFKVSSPCESAHLGLCNLVTVIMGGADKTL
jgi:hypothetical protein